MKRIGTSYGGFPIFKVEAKLYRCRSCKTEKMLETNHYEPCYPRCSCGGMVWDCRELDYDIIIKRMEELENV